MYIPRDSLETYQSLSQHFYSIILRSPHKHLLGWESEETQTARFRVFMEEMHMLIPNNVAHDSIPFSLLDAGCGYAALYAYLKEHKIECAYTGMDYSQECIDDARKAYGAYATFFQANLFEPTSEIHSWGVHDICFISGVLNLNIDTAMHKGATSEVMLFVIEKLLRVSKYGVICNVLHVNSPSKDNTFFYHDPNHLSKFFESNGIQVLVVRDGYLPNDMTFVLQKKERDGARISASSEKVRS